MTAWKHPEAIMRQRILGRGVNCHWCMYHRDGALPEDWCSERTHDPCPDKDMNETTCEEFYPWQN